MLRRADVPNRLLVDHTLASDVQSITFSDLDINTHKSYTIELDLLHGAAGNEQRISMFANGDTTQTNYHAQALISLGSSTISTEFSEGSISETQRESPGGAAATTISTIRVSIRNGKLRAFSNTSFCLGTSNDIQVRNYGWAHNQTVTNLTSLTFYAASTFKAGDKFRIYRGDI